MPSIQKIIISLAIASVAAAQSVAQIGDGQIQVTSAPIVTPTPKVTSTAPAVAQITDGQIQVVSTKAPTTTAPVVASTGAPAPSANGTFSSVKPSGTPFTGAANMLSWSQEAAVLAIGAAGAFAML